MRKACSIFVAALVAAGCTSTDIVMLSDDTAVVSILGTPAGDRDKVVAGALAEAAKLTRAHGYQYFTIIKGEGLSVKGANYVAGETIPIMNSARASGRPLGPTSSSAPNKSGSTYTTPSSAVPYVRPGLAITVRMYRPGEIDPRMDGVWNVDSVPGAADVRARTRS